MKRLKLYTGESVFPRCEFFPFWFKSTLGFLRFYLYQCCFALLYDHRLSAGHYSLADCPRATLVSIGLVCASLLTQILLHPKSVAIYEPNFVIKHIDNFYHFPFHILAIAYLIYLCAIVGGKSVCVIILCVCYFPVTLVNILIHVHAWHCSNDVKTATRRMFA